MKVITNLVEDMLTKTKDTLNHEEKKYIEAFAQLYDTNKNLSTYTKKKLKANEPVSQALLVNILSMENLNNNGFIL